MTDDPTRWLDDEHEDPALRALLRAGREELPTPEALARLEARVLGPFGPGGGGPGEAPPPAPPPALPPTAAAPLTVAAKAALLVASCAGVAVLSALTLALWPAAPTSTPPVWAPATLETSAATDEPPAIDLPRGVDAPAAEAASPRPRRPPVDTPADTPAEGDELSMLSAAQRALVADPARALRLADEHATRFPRGMLAQEREVLAIDALLRLRRSTDARARAARFRSRWPSSAHLRRLDVLLASAPTP